MKALAAKRHDLDIGPIIRGLHFWTSEFLQDSVLCYDR